MSASKEPLFPQASVDKDGAARVTLALPPSVNHLYPTRGGRRVKSPTYRNWLLSAQQSALLQKLPRKAPGGGPYRLEIELYFKDNRRRDASNYIKPIEDFMASWMLYDDRENREVLVRKCLDKEWQRAEIIVRNIGKYRTDTV